MPPNKNQECIIINKNNIDIIGKALEEYWSLGSWDKKALNEINETRMRLKQINDKKINEIKVCWG